MNTCCIQIIIFNRIKKEKPWMKSTTLIAPLELWTAATAVSHRAQSIQISWNLAVRAWSRSGRNSNIWWCFLPRYRQGLMFHFSFAQPDEGMIKERRNSCPNKAMYGHGNMINLDCKRDCLDLLEPDKRKWLSCYGHIHRHDGDPYREYKQEEEDSVLLKASSKWDIRWARGC